MLWVHGFQTFLLVCLGVRFVSGHDSFLLFYAAFNYFFRVVPRWKLGFFPMQFAVSALGSPTETAAHRTVENRRGHLEAPVAPYTVELLLVARSAVNYTVVEPPAPLSSRVNTNQMVFLPLQYTENFCWNQRLHSFSLPSF
jgi:hypothetical protein